MLISTETPTSVSGEMKRGVDRKGLRPGAHTDSEAPRWGPHLPALGYQDTFQSQLSSPSSSAEPFSAEGPHQAQPFSQGLTASDFGEKRKEGGSRDREIAELGLEERREAHFFFCLFCFLTCGAGLSPVCSEIPVSLLPSPGGYPWVLPSLPDTQTDLDRPPGRSRTGRMDAAMAELPGPFLCGALLGFLCLSGEEGPGMTTARTGGHRPGFPGSLGPTLSPPGQMRPPWASGALRRLG